MENASKALLMAAGVLIGLLVLSLAVYLFINFGSSSAEIHQQNAQRQITEFNSQFTKYEGKEDVTIYDVITVANLAYENNIYYNYDSSFNLNSDENNNYISVKLKGTSIEWKKDNYKDYINPDIDEIRENKEELKKYTCETTISGITGRVKLVEFEEKTN